MVFQPGHKKLGGKRKGFISIKNRIKEYYIANPEAFNKAIEYLATNNKELGRTWQMLEGMPKQSTDLTSGGKPIPILPTSPNKIDVSLKAPGSPLSLTKGKDIVEGQAKEKDS